MIKILKHGQGNLIAKCKCGCVFEFGPSDITYENYGIINSYVKCPECDEFCWGLSWKIKTKESLEAFGVDR